MIKKPETMRDRAHNLAQEAVIFGRLGGRTWDGLASLFVTFAEAEIARALSASGAGEDRSSETLDEWYADLVVAIPAALGMTPDPWPNTPAQIEALVREIRRAYPRVPPQEPT